MELAEELDHAAAGVGQQRSGLGDDLFRGGLPGHPLDNPDSRRYDLSVPPQAKREGSIGNHSLLRDEEHRWE